MAYARYGRDSKFYVYWQTSSRSAKTKSAQTLAIQHEDHRNSDDGTLFTYEQVVRMLQTRDFTPIAGFLPEHQDFLRPLLEEFVADVDADYKNNS